MKNPATKGFLLMAILLWLLVPQPAQAQEYPATEIQWITSGSNLTRITTGARLTHHHWYTELTMGGFGAHQFSDTEKVESGFFLGFNAGRRFPLNSWLFLGADLGFRHVMDGAPDKYFTLAGNLKLEAVYNRHLSFFVGGTYTNIYQGYSLGDDTLNKGSVFWGVGLL